MTVEELSALKNEDLKKELKSRGLPNSGNKSELIIRLDEALNVPMSLMKIKSVFRQESLIVTVKMKTSVK